MFATAKVNRLIEKGDPSISFLTQPSLPLSQPSLNFCQAKSCNTIEAPELLINCGICKSNYHLYCIDGFEGCGVEMVEHLKSTKWVCDICFCLIQKKLDGDEEITLSGLTDGSFLKLDVSKGKF